MTFDVAADQLKSIVQRVERLEEEIKSLNDDKSDIYKEARAFGFNVKAIKKVVSQRKLDSSEREEADLVFDTYWNAVHGICLVHAHAREKIEKFDTETGEILDRDGRARRRVSESMDDHKAFVDEMADAGMISEEAREENKRLADAVATKFGNGPTKALQSPRKAAEAVSERTAFTSATIAPVLVEADKAEAVAGVLGQPETIPALTVQHDGVNVGGPERAGVTGGESAATNSNSGGHQASCPSLATREAEESVVSHCKTDAAISRPGKPRPEIENRSGEEPCQARGSGEMQDEGTIHLPTNSDQPLTGGDHVTVEPTAAISAGALVKPAPAIKHRFRPNCQNRDHCKSGTPDHCHSCKLAMREGDAA